MRHAGWIAMLMLLVAPAYGVDGVVEINQAKALAGGATSGDLPGFPVTIGDPGSFRLTSTLERTSGSSDEPVISITTGDVTLDLNGFAIYGSGKVGGGAGIRSTAVGTVSVKNGTVGNLGGPGISIDGPTRLEDLTVRDTGGTGIICGNSCRVTRSFASANGMDGVFTGAHSVVESTVAHGNTRDGISVGRSSIVSRCTASNNGRDGIVLFSSCVARENTTEQNGDNGIDATDAGSNVIDNSASLNTAADLNLSAFTGYGGNVMLRATGSSVSGGVQTSTNLCSGLVCP